MTQSCSFTENCLEDGGWHGCCEAHRAELNGEAPLNVPVNLQGPPFTDDVSAIDPERTKL